jgi:hypothetical protein
MVLTTTHVMVRLTGRAGRRHEAFVRTPQQPLNREAAEDVVAGRLKHEGFPRPLRRLIWNLDSDVDQASGS